MSNNSCCRYTGVQRTRFRGDRLSWQLGQTAVCPLSSAGWQIPARRPSSSPEHWPTFNREKNEQTKKDFKRRFSKPFIRVCWRWTWSANQLLRIPFFHFPHCVYENTIAEAAAFNLFSLSQSDKPSGEREKEWAEHSVKLSVNLACLLSAAPLRYGMEPTHPDTHKMYTFLHSIFIPSSCRSWWIIWQRKICSQQANSISIC